MLDKLLACSLLECSVVDTAWRDWNEILDFVDLSFEILLNSDFAQQNIVVLVQ
jgi:hypothetical protein